MIPQSWIRTWPRVAAMAGLVVAIVVTAVVVLGPRGGTYEVTAVFDQAYGLVAGGHVWAGGAVVGEVADVRLGENGLPRVRMRIEDDYRLRRGATADLRVHSNAGELNRVIVLRRGEGPELRDGAVLARTRTDQPVEIDDVVNTLSPAMRSDLRHVIAQFDGASRGLDKAFREGLSASADGLRETAALLDEVGSDGVALRRLVSEGANVSEAFAADRAALGAGTDELATLLSTVARRRDELRATIREAPGALRATRRTLTELRASVPPLTRLVAAAEPASRELGPTSRLLSAALPAADPALRDLAGTVSGAGPGLDATRRLLDAAGPTSTALTRLLTDGLPDLDLIRSYSPEVFGFFSGFMGQATTYDAVGHAVREYLSPVTSPQNVTMGPDEFKNGWLAQPFARIPGSLVNRPWREFESSLLSRPPRTTR